MTARRLFPSVAAAVLAACVLAALAVAAAQPVPAKPAAKPKPQAAPAEPAGKPEPCADGAGKKQKGCKVVIGPWVAVPAAGEATFLLECPKRAGTIGGTDARASSEDVRVVWEGNTGSPVRPGTTTVFFAFFRASSASGKPGLFQAYIGCIPAAKEVKRSTVSARATRPGPYLDRRQTLVPLTSGASKTATQTCEKKERLLSGWYAVTFGAAKAPDPALANKVHVTLTTTSRAVVAVARTDAGIPTTAQLKLQIGAVCAK